MQNVPLGPADSPHAVRRLRRLGPRLPFGASLLAGGGVLAALGGVILGTCPPQITVALDSGGYHIDGKTLAPRGAGVFLGADGAALVISQEGSDVHAAASTYLSSRHMVGQCVYVLGGDHESCLFTIGDSRVTATDRRTPSGWHRRYADGRELDVEVTRGGAVPVPFAVGR